MQKRIILVLFLLLFSYFVYSSEACLDIIPMAKSSSVGGAYGAVTEETETLWYNPAGLSGMKRIQLSISYVSWIQNVGVHYLSIGIPIIEQLNAGFIIVNFNSKNEYYDNLGMQGADFTTNSYAGKLGLATRYSNFKFGATANVLIESIQDISYSAYSFDMGMICELIADRLNAGLSVRNFGGCYKINTIGIETSFPLNVELSLSANNIFADINVFASVAYYMEPSNFQIGLGGLKKFIYDNIEFDIKAGYNSKTSSIDFLSGFTGGFGITVMGITLDYSLTSFDSIGFVNRVSITLKI